MTFINTVGWLPITIIAYSFLAFAVILDKFLLTQKIQKPSTYAFWVGVFGLLAVVLAPFDFSVLPASVLTNAFISGASFTIALFFFYIAIQHGEASRVIPVIGALSPIFVFILSRGILREILSVAELMVFAVLIVGSVLISISHRKDGKLDHHDLKYFLWIAISAFLFAVTYVYEKAVFNDVSFINGFIWTRIGGFIGALPFLFFTATRESIFEAPRIADKFTIGAFMSNKVLGALGFFLLSYAISVAPSVSLVNAMQGIEYAIIFVAAALISRIRPSFLREEITPLIIFEKTSAIILIGGALAVLALQQ